MIRAAVAALLLAIVWAAPGRADTFVLAGDGDARARPGILIGDAGIDGAPPAVAAHPDGTIAFTARLAVYVVREGRLLRAPVPLGRGDKGLTLAFAPDGDVIVGVCPGVGPGVADEVAAVFRTAPGRSPVRIAGRARGTGRSGDGGPATAALLTCPNSVSVDRNGDVLLLDLDRVRRVDGRGIISTVAGPGREGEPRDGGPATSAWLGGVAGVAALPEGGFAVVERADRVVRGRGVRTVGAVRVVDAAGRISTRANLAGGSIVAEPDGSVLTGPENDQDPTIRRVRPDGRAEVAADLRRPPVGVLSSIPVAGDPFGDDSLRLGGVAPLPDGGMLVSRDFQVVYVAPSAPRVLATALLPRTRMPRRDLHVHLRTTLAGRAQVEAWRDGRRVATVVADVPAGDAVVPVPGLRPGLYETRVVVAAAGQVAVDSAQSIVGGVLPVDLARTFITSRTELFELFESAPSTTLTCRRVLLGRIDCAMIQLRRCVGVAVMRLLADGTLRVSTYDGGRGPRCRFRRPRL